MKQVKKLYHYINSTEGSVKDKVLRSGLWLGMGSSIIRILELFRSIILARLLLTEVFGVQNYSCTGCCGSWIHCSGCG